MTVKIWHIFHRNLRDSVLFHYVNEFSVATATTPENLLELGRHLVLQAPQHWLWWVSMTWMNRKQSMWQSRTRGSRYKRVCWPSSGPFSARCNDPTVFCPWWARWQQTIMDNIPRPGCILKLCIHDAACFALLECIDTSRSLCFQATAFAFKSKTQ